MPRRSQDPSPPDEVLTHYEAVDEAGRLRSGIGKLEAERTRELLRRFLPAPPAVVMDVGGAAGAYALWLARAGYEVHLLDPVAKHVEQARLASDAQPDRPLARLEVGDARRLRQEDQSVDAMLLLGPLYHLTERRDRRRALREARRVLVPGGLLFAAAISRFASALDGIRTDRMGDTAFRAMVDRDLVDGQHRNITLDPLNFTTAYFHRPEELSREVGGAGFRVEGVFAVEGPAWLTPDLETRIDDPDGLERLLAVLRKLEREPSLLGASAHLLVVARTRT